MLKKLQLARMIAKVWKTTKKNKIEGNSATAKPVTNQCITSYQIRTLPSSSGNPLIFENLTKGRPARSPKSQGQGQDVPETFQAGTSTTEEVVTIQKIGEQERENGLQEVKKVADQ